MNSDNSSLSLPSSIGRYSLNRLIGATASLILALALATSGMLVVSYRDTIRQEKLNLSNLSFAFAAQTHSLTQAIDQVLSQIQRDHIRNGINPAASMQLTYLDGSSPVEEYLSGIYIFDNAERLTRAIVAKNTNPASRPNAALVQSLNANTSQPFQITVSDVDAMTGRAVLSFSRALVDAAGRKTGLILAQADSHRFQTIYNSVALGAGGSVTLLNLDGTMLVRGPNLPRTIGRSFLQTPLFQQYLPAAKRGAFEAASPVDREKRLYGYDMVPGYPLVIITGKDKFDALASWYGRLWTALSFLGLISLTVIFLAWRVARDTARQSALIEKLKASEIRLAKSAEYLKNILDSLGTPVWVLDGRRRFVMLNDAFSRFVGRSAEELVGCPEKEVLDPQHVAERERRYEKVLEGSETDEAMTDIRDGNGEQRTVIQLTSRLINEEGSSQIVSVLTDVTERKKAEVQLSYIADFDVLTELPNQSQFRRILEAEVASAGAQGTRLGILVVSLERVQEIVDLMGHKAGDIAVKQIGELFRRCLPRAKCIARVKSNEFAVLVQFDSSRHFLERFASELHDCLSGALMVQGREFYLGPVIGVSIFPHDGTSADELFRLADIARHRASAEAKDPVHFFSQSAHIDLDERLTVEGQLRRALERREFRVVYQPKVNIESGRITGFEALLRWFNPVLGEVSPVRFMQIAESTGLIIPIGSWVLEETCRQVSIWSGQCNTPVKCAVNLSPRQFYQRDLLPMIRRSVETSRINADSLELEITETTLMSHEREVDVLMNEIRAFGVTLSIDDFGTGYSSLAYLKRFPVQRLKIDRAFIRDLGKDEDSAAIVRSIVNLAHGLKLRVVAEGVETEDQLAFLKEISCDEYQGFLFGRPIDASEVPGLVNRNWFSLHPVK